MGDVPKAVRYTQTRRVKLKFALIPWSKNELEDHIFYKDGAKRSIPTESAAYLMAHHMEQLGHEIRTIDYYADKLNTVDFFLFYVLDWRWIRRLTKAGLAEKMVYCNAEPPTVNPLNTPEGYELLKQIFPYLLTWNPEWVDNQRIFKRNIPYYFDMHPCNVRFSERKLVTAISANKHSNYGHELYTERNRAYEFFENQHSGEFDFYGVLWNGKDHPCYKGTVKNKADTFHQYRYAICYENTRTNKDYITEKIWDCLHAQIVPIYAGARNITDYIPKECFIDFYEFGSYEELYEFICNMQEAEYQRYLDAAERLLRNNDVKWKFSGEYYGELIIDAVSHAIDFKPTLKGRAFVLWKAMRNKGL